MNILGIDPGMSGGYVMSSDSGVTAFKMPETEKDLWDAFAWARTFGDTKAYIEDVHAMPGQGVTSMFKFGYGLGCLRMALIGNGIPFEKVSPMKWQKALGCLSKGDKNVTKRKAQELFPQIKVVHWNADALLIAEYGRRVEAARAPERREEDR